MSEDLKLAQAKIKEILRMPNSKLKEELLDHWNEEYWRQLHHEMQNMQHDQRDVVVRRVV